MKVLVISDDEAIGKLIADGLKTQGADEVFASRHNDVFRTIHDHQPTHIVVLDYTERWRDMDITPGGNTWDGMQRRGITAKALRSGWEHFDYPDYIRMPFLIRDLWDRLSALS